MKPLIIPLLLAVVAALPLSAQTVTVFDTVFFSDVNGDRIATMYLPDSSSSNGVGVALGHWWTADRYTPQVWAETLAVNGYTAMAFDYYDFNYRTTICKYPKPVTTFKLAVEFLRRGAERFNLTTGKVIGFGQSEGSIHWGQSIIWDNDDAFFDTDPAVDDHLDAAVLLYGAYDTENNLTTGYNHLDNQFNPFFSLDSVLKHTKGNTIANVANITTPVILFHGTQDNSIHYLQSVTFHDSLIAHGKVSELHVGDWPHLYDTRSSGSGRDFTIAGLWTKDLVLRFLEEHVLLPANMAAGKNVDVHPSYASPQGDSAYITGEIRNPEGHSVTVRAIIEGVESFYTDSLELFDDGQHGDGAVADNLFGGVLVVSGLEEDVYKVGLTTYDGFLDQRHGLRIGTAFTTIGPVVIDQASLDALPDTVFWGDAPLFWLNLRNLGSVREARNVNMKLESDHSCVFPPASAALFGDIQPNEIGLDTPFKVWFHPSCTETLDVRMVARIMSEGYDFWSDTIRVVVLPLGVGVGEESGVPDVYALRQNFPNPFNPSTTIEFALPHAGYVTLKVYNLLGEEVATLVAGDHAVGTFGATWDASGLPSGVYFYRLAAEYYVQTKKAVLMR